MHEMAIAGAVLDCVLESAEGQRVVRVHLQVGHLRQVVPSALHFSWDLITRDTSADGAALEIEQIEAVCSCGRCGRESAQAAFPFRCGACGGLDLEVVRGQELVVDWLEVEQTDEAARGEERAERMEAV